jgi:hypothetical protein
MSATLINITSFNCILRRKEKEINFRKKNSNHIKRKIDVPLEQEMDSHNDDDDGRPDRLRSCRRIGRPEIGKPERRKAGT